MAYLAPGFPPAVHQSPSHARVLITWHRFKSKAAASICDLCVGFFCSQFVVPAAEWAHKRRQQSTKKVGDPPFRKGPPPGLWPLRPCRRTGKGGPRGPPCPALYPPPQRLARTTHRLVPSPPQHRGLESCARSIPTAQWGRSRRQRKWKPRLGESPGAPSQTEAQRHNVGVYSLPRLFPLHAFFCSDFNLKPARIKCYQGFKPLFGVIEYSIHR